MDELKAWLKGRLEPLDAPPATVPGRGDFDLNPHIRKPIGVSKLRPAAVLVPIVSHSAGPTVLLTKRAAHLNAHAGQVSFPGGGVERADVSPIAAALRETREEIGVDPAAVEVIGLLDTYQTGSNYLVTPVVGVVRPGVDLMPDPFEVAEVFEVPLDHLLERANYVRESRAVNGTTRYFYAVHFEQWRIWGATAGMLRNLADRMGAATDRARAG
jgi:8-oxo-dGTP pyrophosphatase MutT (NUDIX family)